MIRIRIAGLLCLLVACAADHGPQAGEAPGCRVVRPSTPLAGDLGETSGLAASRRHAGVLWTHNDSGGDPVLFAVGPEGQTLGRVEVRGARIRDWEDVALGPCGEGDCLYIADIGDNQARRSEVEVYRVPEPDPGAATTARAERFRFRYPDGPRDAEALFVLPSGDLFVVTKGRQGPVRLYRYRAPLAARHTAVLEPVANLTAREPERRQQVTGADASPSGRWVAVRSYEALLVYRADQLQQGGTRPALQADLTGVGEAQGEAVAVQDDGTVWLSSEGGFTEAPGTLARLRCDLPAQ